LGSIACGLHRSVELHPETFDDTFHDGADWLPVVQGTRGPLALECAGNLCAMLMSPTAQQTIANTVRVMI
jgi:hypothetical protein